jgi:4-hydroxy-tetrahydrodipicolinate synthase
VVLGTTGESVVLSKDEKEKILKHVIEINNGRLAVVLGLGGNCTDSVVREYKSYNLDGVDAILSVSPYYNKPSQKGIYCHYKKLSPIRRCFGPDHANQHRADHQDGILVVAHDLCWWN